MERQRERLVVLIGAFKLVKAALLLVLGISGMVELPERLAGAAESVVAWMGISSTREVVRRVLERLWSLDPTTAHRIAVASICYAGIFLVEGLGLVRRKTWAEWLTVFVTASFIPIEVYELARRFGVGKAATLGLNVAIVVYLAWRRLEARPGRAAIRAA